MSTIIKVNATIKKQTYSEANSPKSELVKMFKRLPSRKILEGIYYSTMQLFKI